MRKGYKFENIMALKKVLINKFSVELISILLNIRDYDLVLESLKRGMSENFYNKTKTKMN